jgi:predicted AAA+ superfamily ATPase
MEEEHSLLSEEIRRVYRPRIIDGMLSEKLSAFGGVLITGPRFCGKSWTGFKHSASAFFLGDDHINELALMDPHAVLKGGYPRLVDEWQDVPILWDIARRNIDFGLRKGMYIFTGSSLPSVDKTRHTGIGRFARLEMRTMSLYESGDSSGAVKLSELFSTGTTDIVQSELNYQKAVSLICRGGWPGALGVDDENAIQLSYDYISSVRKLDSARIDGRKRNAAIMELIMRSLARNNATTAKASVIAHDIRENSGEVSEQTVRSYIEYLKKICIIEEQPPWHPLLRSRIRIRTSPVRHFTDPSLAAAVLGARPEMLWKDTKTAGFLFESLCYRDLSVYASAIGGRVFHYRDNSDLEVDAVIELQDGRWGAVEVKMGRSQFDKAASNLIRMKEKMVEAEYREPSFMMILNATGGVARTRPDGVVEAPIGCLGP